MFGRRIQCVHKVLSSWSIVKEVVAATECGAIGQPVSLSGCGDVCGSAAEFLSGLDRVDAGDGPRL